MKAPNPRQIALIGVLAASLIAPWEGESLVVKPDRLAHGLPTGCYGMTPYDVPGLKNGQRFTHTQCLEFLARDIPKYRKGIEPCIHVDLSAHEWAALTSASYNAGVGAVCKSSMVRAFNAGNHAAGCANFKGWYIRSAGVVRKGLINRRNAERAFCTIKDTP